MPIEHTIDHAHKTVLSRVTGDVNLEDLRAYFAEVWAQPEFRGYSEIIDWSGADRIDLNIAELRSLAGAAQAFYDGSSESRLAIVAPGKQGGKMARLYQTLRELRGGQAPDMGVFEDVASARAWLGIPSD
jgi:hypothetical protein